MEDKELAKPTDMVEPNSELNTFPWLSGEDSTKTTLEEPACTDSHDLITRITDETIEGEDLLPETTENWWVQVDDIDWEWMFPTLINKASSSVCDAQSKKIAMAEKTRCGVDCIFCAMASPTNDIQEVFNTTDEPSKDEALLPKTDNLCEDIEGVSWDWINPYLNSDSDNDNSLVQNDKTQVEDDAQPSQITFDNCVAVAEDTFQELNSISRGDIRSPSEITPIREDEEEDSWASSPALSEGDGTDRTDLRTVRSISSSQCNQKVRKCPFLAALASKNSLAKQDLLSLLKDLASKIRDLANDINVLVGRLAVESISDAWIESVFTTTRSINGSLECKSSLSSNSSSASKKHEENVCRDGSWDGSWD